MMTYAAFVDQLKSGHKFDEVSRQVSPEALCDLGLGAVIAAGADLDGAKKKLFYDKQNPGNVFEHVVDYARATPPLTYDCVNVDTLHGIVGACTEAAELAKELQEALEERRPVNRDHLILECGDVLWYLQLIANSIGSTLAEFIQANIDKLTVRYGAELKFTPEKAIARADEDPHQDQRVA